MGFGHVHVAEIESSHVFKELRQRDAEIDPEMDLLGQVAIEFIDELEKMVPASLLRRLLSKVMRRLRRSMEWPL